MPSPSTEPQLSPWPHRLAIALALVTFPLIWVGGLVTTYDAGMAVPDWPGTYGYNLFRYPWQTWLAGPFDLFIEHGHRLLGATAGLIAIALVLVAWATRCPRSILLATCGALALVIVQGILGGARVLMDQRMLALIHGCVGPLFFAYLAALLVATSWHKQSLPPTTSSRFARSAILLVGLAYFQLILGAILRHIPLTATPMAFRAALFMHLAIAAGLLYQGVALLARAVGTKGLPLAATLMLLIVLQILLGGSTYVVKYAFPAWLHDFRYAATYVVQEKSLVQALITTAHVAVGSLILFCATLQAALAARPLHVAMNAAGEPAPSSSNMTFALRRSVAA